MENSSTIFVLDENKNSREIIKLYLEEFGLSESVRLFDDYKLGVESIKQSENPIVFIDITHNDFAKTVNEIKLFSTRIVVTSTDYATDTIIKAMRLGAREFLPKPLIKEDLKRVVEMLIQPEILDSAHSVAKIITVYSNKGGIGKTTIATNLAYELAKTSRDKVALIDLNLQLGDVSTFLDLNPSFDVAYFINKFSGKSDKILLEAFEKYKDTELYVLSDPTYIEQSEGITPQQIETLFSALKRVFTYIIIDMSSSIDPVSLKILDKSDYILFTTIVNIPAVRNAQRCLNLFRSRRYPEGKVKIVINRYMENDDIKIEDIEAALGYKLYWKVPNNYFSIMESINRGIPVSQVNASSNISNSFKDLAIQISDDIVEQTVTSYRR